MLERLLEELGRLPATVNPQRFFREPVQARGISTAAVRQLAKEFGGEFAGLPAKQRAAVAKGLWETGGMEEGTLGLLLYARPRVEADIPLYRSWLRRYVKNWAHCDVVGAELLGPALERDPALEKELVSWSDAPEMWVRRAGMVAFLSSARRGLYREVTAALVEKGLRDRELYVRKGAEWLARQRR